MSVCYKCKICGEQHKAPVTVATKSAFEEYDLGKGLSIYCAVTWKPYGYTKNDLYWVD